MDNSSSKLSSQNNLIRTTIGFSVMRIFFPIQRATGYLRFVSVILSYEENGLSLALVDSPLALPPRRRLS